jgi:tetratricopeptide (TPR) repeat protein
MMKGADEAVAEPGVQAFFEGRALHSRGLETGEPGSFEDAIARFHNAAELDTTLIAPASLWAAWSHLNLGQLSQADSLADRVTGRRGRLSAGDLLMFDLLVSAHLRRDPATALQVAREVGHIDHAVQTFYNNRPLEAIQSLESIGPSWSDYWQFLTSAHHMLGDHEGELVTALSVRQQDRERLSGVYYEVRALAALGRVEAVNARLDEIQTLPPEPRWWGTHVTVISAAAIELRAHGNRAAAIQTAGREIDWLHAHPAGDSTLQRSLLARALYRAERWDEARVLYEQLARESPDVINHRGALGALAARRGDREEALRISEALIATAGPFEFGVEFYWQANIAALLGERELAVTLLSAAFAQGFHYTDYNPHADMDFEPLWDYRPFQEMVRPKG